MTTITTASAPLFFLAIKMNAVFSTICAIFMLALPNEINYLLGIEATLTVQITGLLLLLFAARLIYILGNQTIMNSEAWSIAIGDLLWVAFSAILVIVFQTSFSVSGIVLIVTVALFVFGFAIAQISSLRRTKSA